MNILQRRYIKKHFVARTLSHCLDKSFPISGRCKYDEWCVRIFFVRRNRMEHDFRRWKFIIVLIVFIYVLIVLYIVFISKFRIFACRR